MTPIWMYTAQAFLAPTSRAANQPGKGIAGLDLRQGRKQGGRGRIARWRITAVMLSSVASASRCSMEPLTVHSSSYRAFRRRVCSSRSLRDCSAAIVKTVDMEFSFVVLAAPTIGAACGPEVTISSRRPPHGRRARTKDKKEKSSHAASIAKAASFRSGKKFRKDRRDEDCITGTSAIGTATYNRMLVSEV